MASNLKYLALVLLMLAAVARADLYQNQPGGWVWYDDSVTEPDAKPAPAAASAPAAKPVTAEDARAILHKLGEAAEEAQAEAVLNPTPENIVKDMTLRKQVLAMGQLYAERYEQEIWKHPDLDYTQEAPVRGDALFAVNPIKRDNLMAGLDKAAQSYAIVYVFRSDCPYCKKFSPLLKTFAEAHGFTVMPFSLDGKGNGSFPYPKTNVQQLLAKGMAPDRVPAVYLVDPAKNSAEPIGFGLMNTQDLEQRIALAAGVDVNDAGAASTPISVKQ